MNLSAEQIHLAKQIDAHVRQSPDTASGNEQFRRIDQSIPVLSEL
ncbi:MAG: hypothetical protein OER96_10875 [Gammaproteobacteria bacterium]|nr:hypothetical protein [Gammaproteobacteria bacterium]